MTLLHAPYTLWHLSYVVIGAAIAPDWRPGRLGLALASFALGVGVGAHALDELHGRPLGTRIPGRILAALAALSIAGAAAIGIGAAVTYDLWLLAFVGAGAFLVCAYNLELLGGRVHTDVWFALAWGAFPLLTGYLNAAGRLRFEAGLAAAFAALASYAQRQLSTQVRTVRRRVASVSGRLELRDGSREAVTAETLLRAPEAALRALTASTIALATALVVLRVA